MPPQIPPEAQQLISQVIELMTSLYQKGYAVGSKDALDHIMSAVSANVNMAVGQLQAGTKTEIVPKAPRGSVQLVVTKAFTKFPMGFTVAEALENAGVQHLPSVSEGSVRNYLRDMEKNKQAYRRSDRWFKGSPTAASASFGSPTISLLEAEPARAAPSDPWLLAQPAHEPDDWEIPATTNPEAIPLRKPWGQP